jgi:AAA domain
MVSLTNTLTPIRFAVPDFIPAGYVTFVGAREGVGKTTLLTGLLWQASRPDGGEWLGMNVQHCACLYVNSDAPDGESRPVRYWLEKHRDAFPDGELTDITVLEPSGSGLSPEDIAEIERIAKDQCAKIIVIDSYMGAFPGLDGNKLEQAMKPMQALCGMAARTGAAVIVTDHLPKRAPGEKDGDRGIMGSVAKQAQARAVILMTRIPPAECDGQNAVKIEVTKQSFAHRLTPFGVVIRVAQDEVSHLETVHLEAFDLPEEQTNSGKYRAKTTVMNALKLASGTWFALADLEKIAVKRGNIRERQAKTAVREALQELRELIGDALEERRGTGRGGPKEYRVKVSETPPDHTESRSMADALEATQVTPERRTGDVVPDCLSSVDTVLDANLLRQSEIATVPVSEGRVFKRPSELLKELTGEL